MAAAGRRGGTTGNIIIGYHANYAVILDNLSQKKPNKDDNGAVSK